MYANAFLCHTRTNCDRTRFSKKEKNQFYLQCQRNHLNGFTLIWLSVIKIKFTKLFRRQRSPSALNRTHTRNGWLRYRHLQLNYSTQLSHFCCCRFGFRYVFTIHKGHLHTHTHHKHISEITFIAQSTNITRIRVRCSQVEPSFITKYNYPNHASSNSQKIIYYYESSVPWWAISHINPKCGKR